MTSGHGVAHSEENPGLRSGEMHGMQLWVAQPSTTRDGGAEFEHFDTMPTIETSNLSATVLVGSFAETSSPARRDSALVGVELNLHGGPSQSHWSRTASTRSSSPTARCWSTAPSCNRGRWRTSARDETSAVSIQMLRVGRCSSGRSLRRTPLHVVELCGEVPRRDLRRVARLAAGDDRFGRVASPFARIEVSPPPWLMALH